MSLPFYVDSKNSADTIIPRIVIPLNGEKWMPFETTGGSNLTHSSRTSQLALMMGEPDYRHSYVFTHTRHFLSRQMRAFRGQQSQVDFGKILDKPQSVVSRLEDPNYGKWTLQTLFDIARKLDVAIIVRFVDFSTFTEFTSNMDETAASPKKYDQAEMDELASGAEPQLGALSAFIRRVDTAADQNTAIVALRQADRPQQRLARALMNNIGQVQIGRLAA
jgi:hypothetical protein